MHMSATPTVHVGLKKAMTAALSAFDHPLPQVLMLPIGSWHGWTPLLPLYGPYMAMASRNIEAHHIPQACLEVNL